jgi:hypothetical protein
LGYDIYLLAIAIGIAPFPYHTRNQQRLLFNTNIIVDIILQMKLDLFTRELISVLLWLAFGKLLIIGLFTIHWKTDSDSLNY